MENVFYKNVLFEKFKLGEKRTVLVLRTSKPTYWYNKDIGKTFLVREFKNHIDFHESTNCDVQTPDIIAKKEVRDSFLVLSTKGFRVIQRKDCDVIK